MRTGRSDARRSNSDSPAAATSSYPLLQGLSARRRAHPLGATRDAVPQDDQ